MAQAFGSLRARLLLLLALVTLPALGFILYSASQERSAARQKVEADALYLARLSSREHRHQIAGAIALLTSLSNLSVDWRGVSGACPEPLTSLLQGSPHFANFGVLTPDGKLACSVAAAPGPVDMTGDAAFERAVASDQVEVGEYRIGLIVGRPVLLLARAVRAEGGEPLAVLFGALELRWFNQLAAEAELPPGSSFSLVDRHGAVLAHSKDPERIGETLPEALSLLAARQGASAVGADRDERGIERLLAVAPLAGVSDVSIALSIPSDHAFEPANRQLFAQLFGLGVVLLIAVAGASLGVELLVLRGIGGLLGAVRRLGAGDLEGRAPLRTGILEMDELARAFNAMADALEQRHREASAAHEQLRGLSRRLQSAREEEAARISRDLHDDLGQVLTALKLELAWLGRRLESAPAAETIRRVGELAARVDETIERVRRIATALRPGVLDQLGLGPAVEWQAREFEARTGLECKLELEPLRTEVAAEVATVVFRVLQEALTNVARHAGACAVRIALREEEQSVVLVVADDGRGARAELQHALGSLGIAGMRERARRVGGSLTFESAPGRGTTVTARVPARRPAEEPADDERVDRR